MTDPDSQKKTIRKDLFREKALNRLKGPLQSDTPDTLLPWQPGLVISASLIAIALTILWLI